MSAGAPAEPRDLVCSILIGRVSTEDPERLLETLAALHDQEGHTPFEVIVADRRQDPVAEQARRLHPQVRFVPCAPATPLPMMRTLALRAARGRVVVVTEDHCVPAREWLQRLLAPFDERRGVAAVGGAVVNGLQNTMFDWATYLCEYAAFAPPLAGGHLLPGMNTAYLREALLALPARLLEQGFWELGAHAELLRRGAVLTCEPRAVVHHRKRFSLRGFLAQRYAYSRQFAGRRFERWPLRAAAALACPLLPPVLLWRMLRVAGTRPGLGRPALAALPLLALFYVVWAAGECVGYLLGPGRSLECVE